MVLMPIDTRGVKGKLKMSSFLENLTGWMNPIGAIADIGTGILNYSNQKKQLDWLKHAQRTTWSREDNAVQRRAVDLQAAGLSKTLAAGSAANTSSPINVPSPTMKLNAQQKAVAAMQMLQQKKQVEKTQAETDLINLQYDREARDLRIIKGEEVGQRSDIKGEITELVNTINLALETLKGNALTGAVEDIIPDWLKKLLGIGSKGTPKQSEPTIFIPPKKDKTPRDIDVPVGSAGTGAGGGFGGVW